MAAEPALERALSPADQETTRRASVSQQALRAVLKAPLLPSTQPRLRPPSSWAISIHWLPHLASRTSASPGWARMRWPQLRAGALGKWKSARGSHDGPGPSGLAAAAGPGADELVVAAAAACRSHPCVETCHRQGSETAAGHLPVAAACTAAVLAGRSTTEAVARKRCMGWAGGSKGIAAAAAGAASCGASPPDGAPAQASWASAMTGAHHPASGAAAAEGSGRPAGR